MKATPSPRCRSFLERLSLYVDGDLSGAAKRTVEGHLRSCPCCDEMAESLRRTVSLCRKTGRRRLPPAVRERARARIADLLASESPAPPRSSRSRRF